MNPQPGTGASIHDENEEPPPVLDVHPPHSPTHTWKDFFIHIATIVVGLLIAVGLEQTVERIHQHNELRDTREELAHEFEANRTNLTTDEANWLSTLAQLKNDLLVLDFIRLHPGTPQTALPGDLRWTQYPFRWDHAVRDAAQQNGIVRRMPLKEANTNQAFYGLMQEMSEQSLHVWDAINDAHRFDLVDPDPTHLSPLQLAEVIQLTAAALEKHIQFGYTFGRYAVEFPEMPHTITYADIAKLRPTPLALDPTGMAAAHQRTEDRIKAAAK